MPVNRAFATWEGDLAGGRGALTVESNAFRALYDVHTRFGDKQGTNPDELLGASLAGCFTMALADALTKAEHKPRHLTTGAQVVVKQGDGGYEINRIQLNVKAEVPDIDPEQFDQIASRVKDVCPVGKALAGTEIRLTTLLAQPEE
ncbi:MAG: Peroxiredoxin OsmC [Calditrichaeota bacterium]|nr:Peroxiredoxin OsmC [Calditrichota bacterium]